MTLLLPADMKLSATSYDKEHMVFPPDILAFRLLQKANITRNQKLIIWTGMNC